VLSGAGVAIANVIMASAPAKQYDRQPDVYDFASFEWLQASALSWHTVVFDADIPLCEPQSETGSYPPFHVLSSIDVECFAPRVTRALEVAESIGSEFYYEQALQYCMRLLLKLATLSYNKGWKSAAARYVDYIDAFANPETNAWLVWEYIRYVAVANRKIKSLEKASSKKNSHMASSKKNSHIGRVKKAIGRNKQVKGLVAKSKKLGLYHGKRK
jgi:hypothetical protein